MSVLFMHMYVYHIWSSCPWSSEEGFRFSETGVIDGYELSCESWQLNLVPLQVDMLLTTAISPAPSFKSKQKVHL